MRHFRDTRAIADALADEFEKEGCRVVDQGGDRFAIFIDQSGNPVPSFRINIDRLAADIERRLS